MHDHLELKRCDVDHLAAAGPFGSDTFASVDPANVEYGAPWSDLFDQAWNMNDLIEFAAIAGRAGVCDTGIPLLLRAAHLCVVRQATEALHEGADGDAEGWLAFGDLFRKISALAEDLAADLDERYAGLVTPYVHDLTRDAVYRDADKQRVATALERAANARQRAVRARGDIGPMTS